MSSIVAAMPVYLGTGSDRCFALFHAADSSAARSAVLLCPPFGWEEICSYRSRRDWAGELALAGHPTLRFDLPGSGDSPGGPRDPGRLSAWTQALLDGGEWLRATSGAERLTAIGIGLGGLLAAHAALEGAEIDELVLWAVPARGRSLVRELRAFSRLEAANVVAPTDPRQSAAGADGELVANGYLLSGETVAALERLDLGEPPTRTIATRRVLLLGRDGLKADERLRAAFEQAGASVTSADGPGYEAMMLEPQDARPPTGVFATVGGWLELGESERATPAKPAAGDGVPAASAASARTPRTPAEEGVLELEHAGRRITERTVSLERGGGQLFGVLAEPIGDPAGLCAVLLNAGPQRHTGPNRMWVEIARRWAARGVPTLRIDLAGIGDSDGDTEALVRVRTFYLPEYVEQVREALDMLAERGLPDRFLLLGLCAGAYWCLQAALQDERVAGIAMLNPGTLTWDEWRYTRDRTQELRERLFLASTWRRALRGELTLARHLETARAIAGRALRVPLRARRRLVLTRAAGEPTRDPGEALLDALRDRDQRALLVLSGKERLRAIFERSGLTERLDRWPNLELVLTGTTAQTHTLTPLWLQHEVHALVDQALERELERLAAAAP